MPIVQRLDKKDMDKEDNISYTMEYYPIIEKNELMLFTATMDGPRDYYTKWRSQIEKDRYHDITYMWYMWNVESLYVESFKKTIQITLFTK